MGGSSSGTCKRLSHSTLAHGQTSINQQTTSARVEDAPRADARL
jgi:hypothetical protein